MRQDTLYLIDDGRRAGGVVVSGGKVTDAVGAFRKCIGLFADELMRLAELEGWKVRCLSSR